MANRELLFTVKYKHSTYMINLYTRYMYMYALRVTCSYLYLVSTCMLQGRCHDSEACIIVGSL